MAASAARPVGSPVALITGAAAGIGAATAEEFVRLGWRVVIADKEPDRVEPALRDDPNIRVVFMDVADQVSVDTGIDQAIQEMGCIDALINNAGIQQWSSLKDFDPATWQKVLSVNLYGTLHCMSTVCRHMMERESGAIVNVVSINAQRGAPKRGPYSASKAAVSAITRTAAVEFAPYGIRVNAVGPGYVATPMMKAYIDQGHIDEERILSRIPIGRMAKPGEIASAIAFLASPAASYVTGQVLFVDGGFLADAGIPAND